MNCWIINYTVQCVLRVGNTDKRQSNTGALTLFFLITFTTIDYWMHTCTVYTCVCRNVSVSFVFGSRSSCNDVEKERDQYSGLVLVEQLTVLYNEEEQNYISTLNYYSFVSDC